MLKTLIAKLLAKLAPNTNRFNDTHPTHFYRLQDKTHRRMESTENLKNQKKIKD